MKKGELLRKSKTTGLCEKLGHLDNRTMLKRELGSKSVG